MEDALRIEKVLQQFNALPHEAKREVIDFIAFLQHRYKKPSVPQKTKRLNLADEPFIGIWENREDLSDSVSWVRNVRRHEWKE